MSERELLHTDRVLVVEGKYDAARLSHLTDALILEGLKLIVEELAAVCVRFSTFAGTTVSVWEAVHTFSLS